MAATNFDKPTLLPVPYKGIQFVSIPEFQGMGEKIAQELSAYITNQKNIDEALTASQKIALEVAESGGYKK